MATAKTVVPAPITAGKDRNGFATKGIIVVSLTDSILEKDTIVWGDRGQPFGINVNPNGTKKTDSHVVLSDVTGMTDEQIQVIADLVRVKEGTVIKNNPNYEDVKTDDGKAGDKKADDGINEGTRYNWVSEGALYELV